GAGGLAPSMALAVRTGLVVLLVAFATGAVMVARGVVEARGGQAQLAYDTAGSLKPLHAVAMHVVLVLPALAWLLAHTSWPQPPRLRPRGVGQQPRERGQHQHHVHRDGVQRLERPGGVVGELRLP